MLCIHPDAPALPVLAVDLGSSSMRGLLHIPGASPQDLYFFQLPSHERILAQAIHTNTALGRDVFIHGSGISPGLFPVFQDHLRAGLSLTLHPDLACALAPCPEILEKAGLRVSALAPAQAACVRAADHDPEYWRSLLLMSRLPEPGAVLVSALENSRAPDAGRALSRSQILAPLFSQAGDRGVPLDLLLSVEPGPGMLRLCAIQRMTGFPVLDHAVAFVFGMLAAPSVAARSFREGIVLLFMGEDFLRTALVFQDHLLALLEMPLAAFCKGVAPGQGFDQEELLLWLDELRLAWLPVEKATERGGVLLRAPVFPAEAEGFVPLFVTGPRACLLDKRGHIPDSLADSNMNTCQGLLYAYSRACAAAPRL